jgi:putative colanic acid biosynthesis acetyltransferase WcaF
VTSMNTKVTLEDRVFTERREDLTVELATFRTDGYSPGRSVVVRAVWFLVGLPVLRSSLNPLSGVKRTLLRLFGANVGAGVVIKPGVRVKNPWLLTVGRDCWLGEDCWIDNLVPVTIGDNVCISQGAYLCTGNHDWSDSSFAYRLAPINLRDGCWVGARSLVGPGVTLGSGAVLTAGSAAYQSIPDWEIHSGCPAAFVKVRKLRH